MNTTNKLYSVTTEWGTRYQVFACSKEQAIKMVVSNHLRGIDFKMSQLKAEVVKIKL